MLPRTAPRQPATAKRNDDEGGGVKGGYEPCEVQISQSFIMRGKAFFTRQWS